MIPGAEFLEQFWLTLGTHLWQTTLVLIPLFLVGWAMRGAPARLLNILWWIGLLKILLPLPLLGPLGGRAILPLVGKIFPEATQSGFFTIWAERAFPVLDPVTVVAGTRGGPTSAGTFFAVFTVFWVAGLAWLAVRTHRRVRSLGPRRTHPLFEAEPYWGERLRSALAGTSIPENAVRISEGSSMPSVVGLVRPKITVSEHAVQNLDRQELRAILLHEDEHRRRFDPLREAFQRLMATLFFFYPLLWPLLTRIRASAEMACDEAAIRAGIPPAVYARALARTLRLELTPAESASSALPGGSSLLRHRFLRLEQSGRYVAMRRHRFALIGAAILVALFSFSPLSPFATAKGDDTTAPAIIPEYYVAPEYPESARKAGIEGQVLVEVEVTKQGRVKSARVAEGIPGCPALGESAVEAVKKWRFEPATENGKAVDFTLHIPMMFRLDDGEKSAAQDADVTRPQIDFERSRTLPEYPEPERKAGIEGTVRLEVLVSAEGDVLNVSVSEGIPGHPDFANNAVDAVRQWKFEPGTENGIPTEMSVLIPVQFRLDGDKKK